MEVKSHGYMDKEYPRKLGLKFDAIVKNFPHTKCVYLAIRETWKPKRPKSISYVEVLKRVLQPNHKVFCLKDARTCEVFAGQWEGFVKAVSG